MSEGKKLLDSLIESSRVYCMRNKGTGRTTEMYKGIMQITKAYNGIQTLRILVLAISMRQAEQMRSTLFDMMSDENIACKRKSLYVITTFNTEIVFESARNKNKHAGTHPCLLRFVDHFTQEALVRKGLEQISSDLTALMTGL